MTISTFEQLKTFIDSISSERYYFRGYKNIDELKPTLGRRQNSNRNECAQNAFCQFVKNYILRDFTNKHSKIGFLLLNIMGYRQNLLILLAIHG